jgi:hypothetical protein
MFLLKQWSLICRRILAKIWQSNLAQLNPRKWNLIRIVRFTQHQKVVDTAQKRSDISTNTPSSVLWITHSHSTSKTLNQESGATNAKRLFRSLSRLLQKIRVQCFKISSQLRLDVDVNSDTNLSCPVLPQKIGARLAVARKSDLASLLRTHNSRGRIRYYSRRLDTVSLMYKTTT